MTTEKIEIPARLSYREARDAKRSLCELFGWKPADVVKIEVTAGHVKVWARDRSIHVMATRDMQTSEWTKVQLASYSHASNL